MKNIIKAAAAAAVLGISAATASFADGHGWKPEGPISLIIAFTAGGGTDTQARLIADDMAAATGWEIIPEQVTGKGGLNAVVELKNRPNDGTAIAMIVTETLGYNAATSNAGVTPSDVTALTTTAVFQLGLVAKSDKGWTSVEDMVAAAKGGETLRFGAMSPKLADLAFLLAEAQGIEFNIINVKGGKAVMNGVQAGDMDLGWMAGIQSKGVASGDLVNLASGLGRPLVQTPDAPTMADLGVPFNADGYWVFVAPAGLPDDARAALTDALSTAATTGKASEMIEGRLGGHVVIQGAELDALLQADFDSAGALRDAVE
ncbi:MAG: tripartite tricarboxylate transporter substrate-binding protein [Pseudomonadota bacterium]